MEREKKVEPDVGESMLEPVVIALHLEVEDLRIVGGSRGNKARVEELENTVANVGELGLNLGSVVADDGDVILVVAALFLLLDRGDDAPRGAPRSDHVLVGYKEEIPLFDVEYGGSDGGSRNAETSLEVARYTTFTATKMKAPWSLEAAVGATMERAPMSLEAARGTTLSAIKWRQRLKWLEAAKEEAT
ncbi:hypothetical protein LR48_Vigan11g128000 [Vigna angularis]|uniref:Uncharacterized protein n=1 Tax=Phaseolus angularis TaxID=3914 RepID=A0A0L9VT35_PHAAN|nr:hypothetical protein LR48_Vigan11g128000 [Vigna angularis]